MHHVEDGVGQVNGHGYNFDDAMLDNAIAALPTDARYALGTYWLGVLAESSDKILALNEAAKKIGSIDKVFRL